MIPYESSNIFLCHKYYGSQPKWSYVSSYRNCEPKPKPNVSPPKISRTQVYEGLTKEDQYLFDHLNICLSRLCKANKDYMANLFEKQKNKIDERKNQINKNLTHVPKLLT